MLSCALFSCNDDEPAAPKAKLSIQPTVNKQLENKTGRVAATNDLVFSTGSIKFREVVFDGDRVDNGQSISITHEQIATIDFATSTVSPAVVVEIPAGEYQSIYLGIEIQDEGSTPSVVIEGTYTNSNDVTTPIRFEFNSGEVFEAQAASATLNANQNVVAKITFDPQYWFSTITATQLDNAAIVDGKILINATNNTAIYTVVADRLDDATDAVFQ